MGSWTKSLITPRHLRLLLIGVALALALGSLLRLRDFRLEQRSLLAEVVPALTEPLASATESTLRQDPDLHSARARAARALLVQVLIDEEAKPAVQQERLALARRLAAEAVAGRPVDWQASLGLGASTYLLRSSSRDNRLFLEAPAWEAPLWHSMELAPNRNDPSRFLAMAYLEIWSILPEWKRAEAREVLRRSFTDPATFNRQIEPWLDRASDLEEVLSVVPQTAAAWNRLRLVLAQRRDWNGYSQVSEGWHQALEEDLARRFEEARVRIAGGSPDSAMTQLLTLVREMPVDSRYAQTMADVVQLLPSNTIDSHSIRWFRDWKALSLDLFALGHELWPQEVNARLATLLAASGEPPSPDDALLALASGRARIEELGQEPVTPQEQQYWETLQVVRAREALGNGEAEKAEQLLAGLSAEAASRPAARHLLRQLSPTRDGELDNTTEAGGFVPASAWQAETGRARLELLTDQISSLEIEIRRVGGTAPAVSASWDGEEIGTYSVQSGAVLRLPVSARSGVHLLVLRPINPGDLEPGAVRF